MFNNFDRAILVGYFNEAPPNQIRIYYFQFKKAPFNFLFFSDLACSIHCLVLEEIYGMELMRQTESHSGPTGTNTLW